jgi:hypothetical protein
MTSTVDYCYDKGLRKTVLKDKSCFFTTKEPKGRAGLQHASGMQLVVTRKLERHSSKNAHTGPLRTVRVKNRISFECDCLRYDLTVVFTGESHAEAIKRAPTFEVELELRPTPRHVLAQHAFIGSDLHRAGVLVEAALELVAVLRPSRSEDPRTREADFYALCLMPRESLGRAKAEGDF